MSEKVNSFTAANVFPLKILFNPKLVDSIINNHKILPWHLQLNLTNKCSFNCSFCSCSERDKDIEINFEDLTQFIEDGDVFPDWFYPSATITGGGEPTFYSKINETLCMLKKNKVDIGLVTNGSNIQGLDGKSFKSLTWSRISCSDELPKQTNIDAWFENITQAVSYGANVDWAFSYVLGSQPNWNLLKRIISFANSHNFTHIRIVSDLLNVEKVADMSIIREMLEHYGVDCSRIIFQGRKQFVHGQKKCYISLLKPVISAEAKIFPCCGTQYALAKPSRDYDKIMSMGHMFELPDLINEQKTFDGSNCVRCYYSDYNQFLEKMLSNLEHKRFV